MSESLRFFHVAGGFSELSAWPAVLPPEGFVWISGARSAFTRAVAPLQSWLQAQAGASLVDLHVSDLANAQLPSQFDYTSSYDLLVFRRLSGGVAAGAAQSRAASAAMQAARVAVDTSAVGFAVFDRVLLTVHPEDCAVRDFFVARMSQFNGPAIDTRSATRLPASPDDLMLRMVNHMIDGYLDLRRQLTRVFTELQHDLLRPAVHRADWSALLEARLALYGLEDIGEDQRSALQEWMDALDEWPADANTARERELLRVRARDAAEHVQRVLDHVHRLQQGVDSAVQLHFSAVGQRTNAIMRTLTVITAIFLPLNLITGFFGMNFDALPLIHSSRGIWLAIAAMLALAVALTLFFWRRRYLADD